MTLISLQQIALKKITLFLAGMGLLFTQTTGSAQTEVRSMKNIEMTIWQLSDTISRTMPTSKKSIESLLGIEFKEEGNTPFVLLTSEPGIKLADSVGIDKVSLFIKPSMVFDEKSAFALELSGACIPLAAVREHYGQLTLTQSPRGRSLEETTVYTVNQPWGSLAFAFKEKQPACLFSMTFRTTRL